MLEGIDGVLVPVNDTEVLGRTMERLLGDADLRARLGRKAPDVISRFSVERVMSRWNELLNDVGT